MHLPDAACLGANPNLFDAMAGDAALDALSYCERCAVIPECETLVRPRRSYFDGVCAGKVWREGKPVNIGLFD